MTLETFFEQFELLADAPNGVQKLRELILQLAIQGKLVPQNSDEEPTSLLLDKIRSKQEQMVQDGKIKRTSLPPISLDENPFELPPAWDWVRLGSITEVITKGSSPKWQGVSYVDSEQGILFITSENVRNYSLDLTEPKFVETKFNEIEPRSILKRNDILMNIVGASIGRTAIYDQDAVANINQAVCLIRVIDLEPRLNLSYLLHFFNSQTCINFMFDKQVDNARANLSMGSIAKFPIPLPPLEEQKRIVAKVNDLMTLCDRLEEQQKKRRESCIRLNEGAIAQLLSASNAEESDRHWQRICNNFDLLYNLPENISQLRQAILQLAVQGKLVPQIPQDQVSIKFKPGYQAPSEYELPYDIPTNWLWINAEEICNVIDPQPSHRTPPSVSQGVPYIGMGDIDKSLQINFQKARQVSYEVFQEHQERYQLKLGDFIFGKIGTIGRPVKLTEPFNYTLSANVVLIQPQLELIVPDYLYLYMSSAGMNEIIRSSSRITTHAAFGIKRIRKLPVPVPPIEEQNRIVGKVNYLIKLCDELEAKLKDSQKHQEKSMEVAAVQLMQATNKALALC
jgi:type I restriction enzyme S subunit